MPRYCEVALPVPLRSTFTYAVPASLNGEPLVGRRVVVPFGSRAMIGVGPRRIRPPARRPAHKRNRRGDGFPPRASAEAHRTRPLDQPLLPRARRRNVSRHAPAGNRAAPRPRILAHRFRPRLPLRSCLRCRANRQSSSSNSATARKMSTSQPPRSRRKRLNEVCRRKARPPRLSLRARCPAPSQDAHAKNRRLASGH